MTAERLADERQAQIEEGRRRASTEGVTVTVATIAAWLRDTLRLLVADPDLLIVRGDVTGDYAASIVVIPGSSGNIARVLGKQDEETGITTIRALRTLVGKMAARGGLMVHVHVEAERRPRT